MSLDIRSWWEVPSIAHFCSLFRTAFGLTDFEIEDLEEALLSDGGSVDGSLNTFLGDLHARLLRGLFESKDIYADNFEPFLSQILKIRWEDELGKENPLKEKTYSELSVHQKVEILHDLCDFRLDVADVPELLKGLDADSLRVEPLGRDAKGATYWYFYGTRLYKEVPILSREEKEKKKLLKNKKKLAAKKKRRKKKVKRKKRKVASSDSESDFVTSSSSDNITSEEDEEDILDSESEEDSSTTGWSLACSLASEWEVLAESFKKSKNQDEQLLYQTLSEDFVPEIEKMIEAKEKAYQKKLLDLAPRRASTRIAIKMSLKEEDEREDEEERMKERERMAEEKRVEQEEKQKEKDRQAEKRQQERAERARLREERQWMRMNGEIPPELIPSVNGNDEHKTDEDSGKKKERVPEFEGDEDRDEDLYTGMYKVLDYLKRHNNAWPFLEPVEESYAPQYHEIIEHPMDLSTIEEKLDKGDYKTLEEFQSDMQLMFDNCDEYNGPDSMYTKMANTLKAAFERQIKKHFPEDEDNSDEDFEEELRKGRKKEKENKSKPRKAEFSIDDFITNQDTQSPNKAMGSMPFPFMNEMGMNRVANPMMAARHPQDFQFPQGVAPGFGPDGRPVYPPQFYQNYYNATMARFNIPQPHQYDQYQYQPPSLTRAPMADPQRIGYPQQGMAGHLPFQGPSPNGMTPPGLPRMQAPTRMGHPSSAMPQRPHLQGHQPRPQRMPESSRTPATTSQSTPTSQGPTSTAQPGQNMYPDQFRPNPTGLPTRPEQFRMQIPTSHPGTTQNQYPSYSGPPRLQRAQVDQMAQRRMGNMAHSFGVRPPGAQLPTGFMHSPQPPSKSQAAPTTSVPSLTETATSVASSGGTSNSKVVLTSSENDGNNKKPTSDDSTSVSVPKRIPPVSTSAEPTPTSLTAEKDKREPEQAIAMSRPQSFGQPFPGQPYYGRPMAPYPPGAPHGYTLMPQERHTSVIMPVSGPLSLADKNKPSVPSDADKPKKSLTNEQNSQPKQETITKSIIQSEARRQNTPTPPNMTPKETTNQSSKSKGVGLSISHILGTSPRESSAESPRSAEIKPAVITATRRSPPPLVSDRKRLEAKSDSNRSSPATESPSQLPGYQQERGPGYKSWPLESPSQASPRQGSPNSGTARPRGFLDELFNGKPPSTKDMELASDPLTQGSSRLPFTSLLKEIAPPRENPVKKGPFVSPCSTPQEPKGGPLNLGVMNQAHKDFMTRNYLRDQEEAQRYGTLVKQMNPYSMYGGKMGPESMTPLSYRAQGQEMSSVERQRAIQVTGKRTPDSQYVDLDAMQYREQPGYVSREQLFLMEQRRQQERMTSSRSSVIGGEGIHVMGYPSNMMLHQQQQQQLLQAMYENRLRNGEFPNSMLEDVPPSKIPRFS